MPLRKSAVEMAHVNASRSAWVLAGSQRDGTSTARRHDSASPWPFGLVAGIGGIGGGDGRIDGQRDCPRGSQRRPPPPPGRLPAAPPPTDAATARAHGARQVQLHDRGPRTRPARRAVTAVVGERARVHHNGLDPTDARGARHRPGRPRGCSDGARDPSRARSRPDERAHVIEQRVGAVDLGLRVPSRFRFGPDSNSTTWRGIRRLLRLRSA